MILGIRYIHSRYGVVTDAVCLNLFARYPTLFFLLVSLDIDACLWLPFGFGFDRSVRERAGGGAELGRRAHRGTDGANGVAERGGEGGGVQVEGGDQG